ncbi:MAG: MerR family DNA-binding transcriptional regulator [Cyanobacteriota bacterium]|nr:MerR family DNA-binding transcriptional regulator [Cyanobacteriota bacterium]
MSRHAWAAEHYGVNISTLRPWDNEGKLDSIRTPGNQRRFCIDEENPKSKPVITDARVSSHGQRYDLD